MRESNLPSLGGGKWIDNLSSVGCCTCLAIRRSARGRDNRRRRMLNRNMPRYRERPLCLQQALVQNHRVSALGAIADYEI